MPGIEQFRIVLTHPARDKNNEVNMTISTINNIRLTKWIVSGQDGEINQRTIYD